MPTNRWTIDSTLDEIRDALARVSLPTEQVGFDTGWYRIHSEKYAGDAFNNRPATEHWTGGRFHPFTDAAGQVVGTLYAGNNFGCAVAETIFHDVPIGGEGFVPKSRLLGQCYTTLQTTVPLTLIKLCGLDARRLPIDETLLSKSEPTLYPFTQKVVRALYDLVPAAQGLLWISRQHSECQASVLFEPRIRPGQLVLGSANSVSLFQPAVYQTLLELAAKASIKIGDA